MRVLLDTNTIIDYLAARKPFDENAETIFNLVGKKNITGYVNTSSVTDIYYILRKTLSDADCRSKLKFILRLLQVIEVSKNDCLVALDSLMLDFEDALVTVCAENLELDYIVTRDREFLKLPISISPQDFLAKCKI